MTKDETSHVTQCSIDARNAAETAFADLPANLLPAAWRHTAALCKAEADLAVARERLDQLNRGPAPQTK